MPDEAVELALAARMGVDVNDIHFLRQALTHRSVLHDWTQLEHVDATLVSNERLEFLGDAILGVVVAYRLYQEEPEADEGTLTRHRAALVRGETLVRWARELGVPEALYLGAGEKVGSGTRDRMLAGAFESLVGAIFLDQGWDAVVAFIERFLDRDQDGVLDRELHANPKGTLLEFAQQKFVTQPVYETIQEDGPEHDRQFTVSVSVNEEMLGTGVGRSKREAQQAAAEQALQSLKDHALLGADPK